MDTPLASQPPSILDQLLTPLGDCLTPEVARHLVELHASADVQARLEELADKSTEGQLSDAERAEYATAVAAIEFISVLQPKARRLLSPTPARSTRQRPAWCVSGQATAVNIAGCRKPSSPFLSSMSITLFRSNMAA